MPSPPDFSEHTIRTLSERSAMICNNPRCATVTVGPSDAAPHLKLKIGEAAHIRAKHNGARYDSQMNDEERADVSNGIWLCASCHSLIDKNGGADFTVDQLEGWKRDHEALIRALLLSHRSPVPILRTFTEEGRVAQKAIDVLESHGALFVDMNYEVADHVLLSIDRLRCEIKELLTNISYDKQLKYLLQGLQNHLRDFMNETSAHPQHALQILPSLRVRVGVIAGRLRDEFGATIRGDLNRIFI